MLDVLLQITHERANIKQLKLGPVSTIGRSAECNVKIASGEISRKHCRLTVDDNKVLIRDLASSNGTYINGKLIPPNVDIELSPGSRLTIGPVKCVVQFLAPDAATALSTQPVAQAGDTLIATPESTAHPKASDLDFAITRTEEAGAVVDEIVLPTSPKPDTELELNLGSETAGRVQETNTGEPSSARTSNGETASSQTAESNTEFLFGPDDTVQPGTLVASKDAPTSFGVWTEPPVNELALPIEPVSAPATKKKKGLFDLFKRKAKVPTAPPEAASATLAKAPEQVASAEGAPSASALSQSVSAVSPVAQSSNSAADAAPVPTTPATGGEDIEPFWN